MNLPRTFVLTVDRDIQRFDVTAKHLDDVGIKWERFNGFDNQICRLLPIDTFDLDRAGEKIGSKHIAATLSHYLIWKVMQYQPDDSFIVLEYDVEMAEKWDSRFYGLTKVLPDDWDIVFLGSCCCKGRETKHISGDCYEVKYPLCGHAMMFRKKALTVLLKEHQKICMPLDVALFYQSLPKLRVYTAIPPIVNQRGTPLPP